MLRTIKTVIIISLWFLSPAANGQDQNKNTQPAIQKKNIIKINLPALAFKNISVQYERAVGKRISIAVNVHTIPFGKLPFRSSFEKFADQADIDFNRFKFGSFGIVPEYRYYVGKKGALHGFYIAAFGSFSNHKINLPVEYTSNNTTKTGIFDGKLNTTTVGLQFGSQFSLGKNMVLDWWIFGPNYGSASGSLRFTGTLNQSEQDELKKQLENVKNDLPFDAIESYTVNSTGALVNIKGPWRGLRGLGFCLGIRF